uniref:Uncharacterized protein n=1 Tax=Anguilla anguilla TaxID=7936 RepID=A0A0E9U2Q6_ANGAN
MYFPSFYCVLKKIKYCLC